MAKKHPLFCTKDVFQTPVGLINRSTDQKRFQTSLSEHVAPVTTVAQMNRYIIEAVTILGPAIVKGDTDNKLVSLAYGPSNSENCLDLVAEVDDPSGGCIIAQLVIPVDTSVQGFEALGKEAHIAAMRVTANGTQEPLPSIPSVSTKEAPFSLLAMYMLITMTLHIWDGEFCENLHLVTAKKHMDRTPASKEEMETAYLQMSHVANVVFGENNPKSVQIKMGAGNNIPQMRTFPAVDPANDIIFGEAKQLLGGNTSAASAHYQPKTFGEAKALFAKYAASKTWTKEEEDLIPTFPDDYPMMPETLKIARRFVRSRDNKRPMNNFLWRGITSYGKSTGVEMIAALLHTPLVRMTCSTTTETQDFLSQFVPCNDADLPQGQVPDIEQMMYDPEGSYLAITGNEKEGATAQECLDELLRRVAATKGDTAKFKHVESNFVKALAHGWICEIQEFSRIRDPGVLVGLNEYDRPNAIVPLADGGYVRRSHDAMVIYTDNVGLASCRPVDASVIRRMAFAIDSDQMPKQTVIDRVKYNTGFDDDALLDAMYTIWKKIQGYCSAHDITEGPVSVTELEMWAQTIWLEAEDQPGTNKAAIAYETVLECVIAKATSVVAEQKEIQDACASISMFGLPF